MSSMFIFFKSSYFNNRLWESVHIGTIGTLSGGSTFTPWYGPQGSMPRSGAKGHNQGHLLKVFVAHEVKVSITYISRTSNFALYPDEFLPSSTFALYLEEQFMYKRHTFWLWVSMTWSLTSKCRSQWPIFHGPVILLYILKWIWYINIMLLDYKSVWPEVWSQNKYRSQ